MLISQKCCNLSCAVSYNKALHKNPSANLVWFWAGVSSSRTLHYPSQNACSVGRDVTALGCQNPPSFPKTQTYATEGDT